MPSVCLFLLYRNRTTENELTNSIGSRLLADGSLANRDGDECQGDPLELEHGPASFVRISLRGSCQGQKGRKAESVDADGQRKEEHQMNAKGVLLAIITLLS